MSLQQPSPPQTEQDARIAQDKAVFLMDLRARGIQDLNLLRALEIVSFRTVSPISRGGRLRCRCAAARPFLTRMIEALAPARHHRVLEIGTGSGYATALLARLSREVLSIERFQSLAIEAEARLARLGITNAGIVFGDGLAILPNVGPFDRIIVQGLLIENPENLIAAVGQGGVLVAARPDHKTASGQRIARIARNEPGGFDETLVCASRLQSVLPGEAQAL